MCCLSYFPGSAPTRALEPRSGFPGNVTLKERKRSNTFSPALATHCPQPLARGLGETSRHTHVHQGPHLRGPHRLGLVPGWLPGPLPRPRHRRMGSITRHRLSSMRSLELSARNTVICFQYVYMCVLPDLERATPYRLPLALRSDGWAVLHL